MLFNMDVMDELDVMDVMFIYIMCRFNMSN